MRPASLPRSGGFSVGVGGCNYASARAPSGPRAPTGLPSGCAPPRSTQAATGWPPPGAGRGGDPRLGGGARMPPAGPDLLRREEPSPGHVEPGRVLRPGGVRSAAVGGPPPVRVLRARGRDRADGGLPDPPVPDAKGVVGRGRVRAPYPGVVRRQRAAPPLHRVGAPEARPATLAGPRGQVGARLAVRRLDERAERRPHARHHVDEGTADGRRALRRAALVGSHGALAPRVDAARAARRRPGGADGLATLAPRARRRDTAAHTTPLHPLRLSESQDGADSSSDGTRHRAGGGARRGGVTVPG